MTTTAETSQARHFAAEYAANSAREMLDTIGSVGKKAGHVSRIVLAVSMPHQIAFILSLAPLAWGNVHDMLFSFTLILAAVLVPIAVDYLILICIQVIAARAMAKNVKQGAIAVMAFPILISGAVNVLAPAPWQMRVLFGAMVVLIPLAEGLRAFIRPDFGQIEAMEKEVASQVSVLEPQVDIAEVARQEALAEAEAQRIAAAEVAAERRRESAAKAAQTRAENKAREEQKREERNRKAREAREAKKLEELIPTSPGHPAAILSAKDKKVLEETGFQLTATA